MPKMLAFALMAVALSVPADALAQERFGFLIGQITDQQNAPLPGATVTITDAQTQENTDPSRPMARDGIALSWRRAVTPCDSARQDSATLEDAENVLVLSGATFELAGRLPIAAQTETVQVTSVKRPRSSTRRSTVIAHNVSAEEEFDRLPKGAVFQSIALTAPVGQLGRNRRRHPGQRRQRRRELVHGRRRRHQQPDQRQSRQNTVFEYLQEVQVKTGGIEAEYGGALGGVISAVTKSRRQHVPRRGPLLLRRQRARAPAR